MNKYFEKLMTTPCVVWRKVKTEKFDRTASFVNTAVYQGNCNFHTIKSVKSQFADKIGQKTVSIVCLPVDTDILDTDVIEINNIKYDVIGIRKATREYEKICEVTANE